MLQKVNSSAVLSAPLSGTNFSICNELWNTTGTCCDVATLNIVFNATMANTVQAGFNQFMSGLQNVGNGLQKITQQLSNVSQVTAALTSAMSTNASMFPPNMTVAQGVDVLAEIYSFKNDVAQFKTDGQGCFNALVKASGKLFCYGCAGQTQTGMNNTDGSTTVTQGSCVQMLNSCMTTWKFMFRVGNMMNIVSILNSLSNSNAPAPKPQAAPGFGGVAMSDLVQAYADCNSSINASTCTDTDKANLCKGNYNIMAPPKNANGNNMQSANTASLSASGPPVPNNMTSNGTAPSGGKRILGTTSSSGDVGIGAAGADLTASITTPSTSASVDSSSTNTGISSVASSIMVTVLAAFAALSLLN